MSATVEFAIAEGELTAFDADVVALKHARSFNGVDRAIAERLMRAGLRRDDLQPPPGECRLAEARGAVHARHVLFVGVPPLYE